MSSIHCAIIIKNKFPKLPIELRRADLVPARSSRLMFIWNTHKKRSRLQENYRCHATKAGGRENKVPPHAGPPKKEERKPEKEGEITGLTKTQG